MFDNIFNKKINNTKFYKTPEEAIYNGYVLGQVNGAYDPSKIKKEDGSLKPMRFSEASTEDRFKVFEYIKSKEW